MQGNIKINSVNQFKKGTIIYREENAVSSVALVVKGRIIINNKGSKVIVNSGSFIGINDLYTGKYQSTYIALEDTIFYAFEANKREVLDNILAGNKDYNGLMVATYSIMISQVNKTFRGLIKHGIKLSNFLIDKYNEYTDICQRLGYEKKGSIPVDDFAIIEDRLEPEKEKIDYYSEYRNLPIEAIKELYSHSTTITSYQVKDQIDILNQLIKETKTLSDDIKVLVGSLISDDPSCLFMLIATLAVDVKEAGGYNNEIVAVIDKVIDEINEIENFFDFEVGSKLAIDRTRMEEIYFLLLNQSNEDDLDTDLYLQYSVKDSNEAMSEMTGALDKILKYGQIEVDVADQMRECVLDFLNIKDKYATDDATRKLRRDITDSYYKVYKSVFLKAYEDGRVPRLIDMFLNYGFTDERLLTQEQQLHIYFMEEESASEPCLVYHIKEWLTLILEGKKEPSKNEFDLDYNEMLFEEKRHGRINDEQMKELQNDKHKKFDYEIENMLRYNNRIVSGQITSFVPILHKDVFMGDIKRSEVSGQKLNNAIVEIMKIDFSVFDREAIYSDEMNGIKKEQIIKQVFPDIILMPSYGANSIMWQDIAGRKRDTPGRFIFPSFTDEDISKLMVKMLGQFRWELCRTIQGVYWNDVTYKSLTSEYGDYLQFYRRNRDLSEDNKEKLKFQIQKGRNNSREIFVMDYEVWIRNEANGAIKLNRVVREIMATHCPFTKEIRERIMLQPLFEAAMSRYQREKVRKIKEIEGRYRVLERDSVKLPKELIDTLNYYKDL